MVWGALIEAAQKDWQNDRNQIIAYTQKKQDRKYNASMALAQMVFDKQMADTQYQRGVDDLKKAGLNPVLAAGGANAATATATLPQQSLESVSGAMGEGGNIGSAIRNWQEHKKLMQVQDNEIENSKKITNAQVGLLNAQRDKTKEETNYVGYFPETTSGNGSIFGVGGGGSKTIYKKPGQTETKTNSAVKQSNYSKKLKKWLGEQGINE